MKTALNDNWRFRVEGGEWRSVELPHDAMLEGGRSAFSPTGKDGGYFPGGKYEYETILDLAETDLELDLRLHFEGVYRNATILVNGEKAYFQAYGFSDFFVPLNALAKPGKNPIKVEVDNSLVPNARWYTGAGIYRPVYLEKHDPDGPGEIRVKTISVNPTQICVEAKEGSKVAIYADKEKIYEGFAGEIEIPSAHLWSAEDPFLYELVVTRGKDSELLRFGIREIRLVPGKGLLINGVSTKLKGACIHSDNGILGARSYRDYEFRRVKLLKEAGFNALRMAHNPCCQYVLEAADELGMYILDEAFDGWYTPKNYHDFSRQFEQYYPEVIKAMAHKDFNHPSVIMYSLGNEVTETAENKGLELVDRMVSLIKGIDTSRPITCGVNLVLDVYAKKGIGIYKDKGDYRPKPIETGKKYKERKRGSALFNAFMPYLRWLFFFLSKGKTAEQVCLSLSPKLDILGYNYGSSRYAIDGKNHPDWLLLGTETMPGDLPYNYKAMAELPNLVGDFVWAGYDYIGEALIGDWTYYSYSGLPKLAGQGLTDINGYPKGILGYCQVAMKNEAKPYIAVRPVNHYKEKPKKSAWQFTNAIPSWTFFGYEGKKALVEVYSAAPSVTLSLNGRVIGSKPTNNNIAKFSLPYTPGILRAVALDKNGDVVGESTIRSAKKDIRLSVKADVQKLSADRLAFLSIGFADEDGVIDPTIEVPVKVETKGPIRLLGLGSGLCKTDESFLSSVYHSYQGRLMAIIKAEGRGKGEAIISAEGHDSVKLEFDCL